VGVDRLRFETTSHYRFQRYRPLVLVPPIPPADQGEGLEAPRRPTNNPNTPNQEPKPFVEIKQRKHEHIASRM